MKNGILIFIGILLLGVIAFVAYKMLESKEEVKTAEKKKQIVKDSAETNAEIFNAVGEMYGIDFATIAKQQSFGQRQS